ncbi:MAG TPA: hypothetical protein VF519_14395 [Mycobacteriales bacterium]|jgi:hypothetical protein
MRLVLAAALAVAALAAVPADAVLVCRSVANIGGACVYVDPKDPDPVDVSCGGTFWTCRIPI